MIFDISYPKSSRNIRNPHLKAVCPEGYVLKILNSFDSKKIGFVEGQTALSLYLSELWPFQVPFALLIV